MGLAIAGPSEWPGVLGLLALGGLSITFGIALWTGFGGRRLALLSLVLGLCSPPPVSWLHGRRRPGSRSRISEAHSSVSRSAWLRRLPGNPGAARQGR